MPLKIRRLECNQTHVVGARKRLERRLNDTASESEYEVKGRLLLNV